MSIIVPLDFICVDTVFIFMIISSEKNINLKINHEYDKGEPRITKIISCNSVALLHEIYMYFKTLLCLLLRKLTHTLTSNQLP